VGGNVRRSLDGVGPRAGSHVESAVEDSFKKANLGGGDVPREFERRLRIRIWPIVALVRWNGLDDALGDAMLVLEGTQQNVVQPEFGVVDRHGLHSFLLEREAVHLANPRATCATERCPKVRRGYS